jgi:hypothetical protein
MFCTVSLSKKGGQFLRPRNRQSLPHPCAFRHTEIGSNKSKVAADKKSRGVQGVLVARQVVLSGKPRRKALGAFVHTMHCKIPVADF